MIEHGLMIEMTTFDLYYVLVSALVVFSIWCVFMYAFYRLGAFIVDRVVDYTAKMLSKRTGDVAEEDQR